MCCVIYSFTHLQKHVNPYNILYCYTMQLYHNMWSQIYPSTVCSQLYTLWLTPHFTDLCRLPCIDTSVGWVALAYPSSQAHFMRDHACSFPLGNIKVTSSLIFHRICSKINYLVEGDKWYAISCHTKVWVLLQDYHTKSV